VGHQVHLEEGESEGGREEDLNIVVKYYSYHVSIYGH